MFLPTTRRELDKLGWKALDVILVTGDAYIDSPFVGVAVVGKVLLDAGYRVGVIGQPDIKSGKDISRLGEPRLFWGVTAGCVDSLVANRTASGKPRRQDDYTPGGENNRRPDRACIVYSNLIREHFKQPAPIVLGGIEASLRRIAHYDFWSNKIRRSVLFDAKADYLLYGMAETSIVELARRLRESEPVTGIRGLCYAGHAVPEGYIELPAYEEARTDKQAFTRMFEAFYDNNDPVTAAGLAQKQDARYLIQNPPPPYLKQAELDAVHDLDYERDLHPYHQRDGAVRALDTIRFSITTHRGCYGECNFCAIAVHQGRTVRWRSEKSILREARAIAAHPQFKGIIQDVGGPTANMYGFECARKDSQGCCRDKRCMSPTLCKSLNPDHGRQLSLLRKLRHIEGVRKVVVASGIRHDLVMADGTNGQPYLRDVLQHHTSGQLKIAPEHTQARILGLMGKPDNGALMGFVRLFRQLVRETGREQYLTYYFIAAHPGCTDEDMQALKRFAAGELRTHPRQVQIFTPTPSTYSTLMYWTGLDPENPDVELFVERSAKGRERQKQILLPLDR